MPAITPSRALIFQCPLCKELTTLQQFSCSEQGITILCTACEDSFFYAASASATASDTPHLFQTPTDAQPSAKQATAQKSTDAKDTSDAEGSTSPEAPTPAKAADSAKPPAKTTDSSTTSGTSEASTDSSSEKVGFGAEQKDAQKEETATSVREEAQEAPSRESKAQEGPPKESSRDEPDEAEVSASKTSSEEEQGKEKALICPKCSHALEEIRADCPKCGLLFENIGVTYSAINIDAPKNFKEREVFALWKKVLDNWEESEKHELFLQACSLHGMFELAASLYQREKLERGEDDPVSKKQLDRLVDMVQQQFVLQQQEEANTEQSVKTGKLLLTAFVFVLGLFLFYMMFRSWTPPTR